MAANTLTGFDFEVWQRERQAIRDARVLELQRAMEAGATVRETLHGTPPHVIHWPEAGRAWLRGNSLPEIARHVESREYGFGFKVEVIHAS